MKVEKLVNIIGADFYTGVPDSQLKPLCNYLISKYGIDSKHHVIAANEGNCVAVAAGYHLATRRVPVVYMQNSGEGNVINPVVSLLNDRVYAIPMVFIIGWRGEPGECDEPQHIYQGEITIRLLEDIGIETFVIGKDTCDEEVNDIMGKFRNKLLTGKQVAFVVKKGALSYDGLVEYKNENFMIREEVINHIVAVSSTDLIISTTGKASRELFEVREANKQGHQYDFLTVGSMGHASSIAFGVSVNCPDKKIWCIDGDGAALMHMGAMAVIGDNKPNNLVHVLINNGSHETVGGMPTVATNINFVEIAKACGYSYAVSVENYVELDGELEVLKRKNQLCFIEAKCAIGSRKNLGRPTTTALENKQSFMNFIEG